jgi:hypothetical protein
MSVVGNVLPPAFQCELGEKDSESRATSFKDSVNIVDSVRWITKTRWKTRYRDDAHITHRGTGNEMSATTPDSLPSKPENIDMLGREEKPKEGVVAPKAASIQLTVDGKIVYSTNDNHSAEEGQ